MSNFRPLQDKSQISIQEIINNPFSIESDFVLKTEKFILRPLVKADSTSFGVFLEGLSEKTRERYGPHPLNSKEAKNICDNLNYTETLRLAVINSKNEIVGYMILSFRLRESQILRHKEYGIPIEHYKDACIAPVVADKYQNKGLGSVMLQYTIELAKLLGLRQIILWQGTQVSNKRATHTYEKLGFKKIAKFERYGTTNYDMCLQL